VGRPPRGEECYRGVVGVQGRGQQDALAQQPVEWGQDAGTRQDLVAEAVGSYGSALELREALHREKPDSSQFLSDLEGTEQNLGETLQGLCRHEEGLAACEKATDVARELVEKARRNRSIIACSTPAAARWSA
jgi:hypothetical protein